MSKDHAKTERFMRQLEPLQGALEAYCRCSLRDRNAVADVLQSAVGNAFRDFHLYVEGSNFRAWIFRYVHLEIQNCNRKHKRTKHEELPAELSVEDAWNLALDEPLFKVLLDDPEAVLEQCDAALAQAVGSCLFQNARSFFSRPSASSNTAKSRTFYKSPSGR